MKNNDYPIKCLFFGLWFGIVWCWRSISCFWLFASLPYMSIRAGVVIAVALQQIDNAPNAKARAQRDNEGLKNTNRRIEKCHRKLLSCRDSRLPRRGGKGRSCRQKSRRCFRRLRGVWEKPRPVGARIM